MGLNESVEGVYKSRENDGIEVLSREGGDQEEDSERMIREVRGNHGEHGITEPE